MNENWIIAIATVVLASFGGVQLFREFYSARTNKTLAAKEKAFEQINRHVFDHQIVEMFERWRFVKSKYQDNQIDFASVMESYQKHKEYVKEIGASIGSTKHDYDYVIQLLNFYEQISIGILRGTVDEETYKEWWRTSFVLDWLNAKDFVEEFRKAKGSSDTFSKYEFVANRWKLPGDDEAAKRV